MNSERITLQAGKVFNVRQFGAFGNGSTDDTVAIQATIDAALQSGAQNNTAPCVVIPAGKYRVDQHLSNPECAVGRLVLGGSHGGRLHIRGEGGATLSSTADFYVDGALDILLAVWGPNYRDVLIENLRFERIMRATKFETVAIGAMGLRTTLRNCTFVDFPQAVLLQGAVAPVLQGCRWEYSDGRSCGDVSGAWPAVGVMVQGCQDVRVCDNFWRGTEASGATAGLVMDGFVWGDSRGWIITGNTARFVGVEGIYCTSSPNGDPTSSAIIEGNTIDCDYPASVAAAAHGGVRMGIRCDDWNPVIRGNVIMKSRSPICIKNVDDGGAPFPGPTRAGGLICDNLCAFDAADVAPVVPGKGSVLFGVLVQNHDRVRVRGNSFAFPAGTCGLAASNLPTACVVLVNSANSQVTDNEFLAAGPPDAHQGDLWGVYYNGSNPNLLVESNTAINMAQLAATLPGSGSAAPQVGNANRLFNIPLAE